MGVVADTRHSRIEELPVPSVYMPLRQGPWRTVDLTVRTRLSTAQTAAAIRGMLHRIDPAVPVGEIRSIEGIVSAANAPRRFETSILGGFAGFALLLASVALYGLTSYSVRQRTPEIGIRMALGASKARIVIMILRHHLGLVVAGLAVALAITPMLTRFIKTSLYDVSGYDLTTYLFVSGMMLAITCVACLIPVWKAMGGDPLAALRYE